MHAAAITYGNRQLEAREQNDVWTVRLAQLETRALYLDLALAELLGNAHDAHRAAARLLSELAEVVEQQQTVHSPVPPAPQRNERPVPGNELWAKALVLGLRGVMFAAVAGTAFMLTTWLTTVR